MQAEEARRRRDRRRKQEWAGECAIGAEAEVVLNGFSREKTPVTDTM